MSRRQRAAHQSGDFFKREPAPDAGDDHFAPLERQVAEESCGLVGIEPIVRDRKPRFRRVRAGFAPSPPVRRAASCQRQITHDAVKPRKDLNGSFEGAISEDFQAIDAVWTTNGSRNNGELKLKARKVKE